MPKSVVIDAIAKKVARLIEENRRLLSEREHIAKQHDKLKTENRSLKEQAAQLEKRIAKLELQGGLSSGVGDKKAARARVNRLMREVDRCIALLNK